MQRDDHVVMTENMGMQNQDLFQNSTSSRRENRKRATHILSGHALENHIRKSTPPQYGFTKWRIGSSMQRRQREPAVLESMLSPETIIKQPIL
jgi:hypothetical protein